MQKFDLGRLEWPVGSLVIVATVNPATFHPIVSYPFARRLQIEPQKYHKQVKHSDNELNKQQNNQLIVPLEGQTLSW